MSEWHNHYFFKMNPTSSRLLKGNGLELFWKTGIIEISGFWQETIGYPTPMFRKGGRNLPALPYGKAASYVQSVTEMHPGIPPLMVLGH